MSKESNKKPDLRKEMPTIAAFIDSLRDAFGRDSIDKQIRKGMKGEPTFYASENGHEIGTRVTSSEGLDGKQR